MRSYVWQNMKIYNFMALELCFLSNQNVNLMLKILLFVSCPTIGWIVIEWIRILKLYHMYINTANIF